MYFYDKFWYYYNLLQKFGMYTNWKKGITLPPSGVWPTFTLDLDGEDFFMKLVLSPTRRKGNTKTANSRLMQRMYQCLLLFFFLYAYLCLLSSVVIYQYNILALEHQFSPGKYWNPYSLNLIIIKYALKKYAVNVISSMQTDLYTSEILSSVGL